MLESNENLKLTILRENGVLLQVYSDDVEVNLLDDQSLSIQLESGEIIIVNYCTIN